MSHSPLVSIIINNYNYGRFLAAAIDSALNQTYSRVEVIVVDDGSTDESQEVIDHYTNRVIPILKQNGGQASAFNAGFAVSQGNIICFLDADDLFLPEKAAAVVQAFQSYPEAGWCFHPLQRVDENAQPLTQPTCSGVYQTCDFRSDLRLGKARKLRKTLPFSIPPTSGLCFTRSHLNQILPMPEAERISLNDTYLQFTSIALSQGITLDQALSQLRVHGQNALTAKGATLQFARILVLSAYWIRRNFPEFRRLSDGLFASGLGMYWRLGGVDARSQEVVREYLSTALISERIQILIRALYRTVRLPV
jgi:glycosyltransferase involved in cell wall biosynthesis